MNANMPLITMTVPLTVIKVYLNNITLFSVTTGAARILDSFFYKDTQGAATHHSFLTPTL